MGCRSRLFFVPSILNQSFLIVCQQLLKQHGVYAILLLGTDNENVGVCDENWIINFNFSGSTDLVDRTYSRMVDLESTN